MSAVEPETKAWGTEARALLRTATAALDDAVDHIGDPDGVLSLAVDDCLQTLDEAAERVTRGYTP